jgi:hypothetical protein
MGEINRIDSLAMEAIAECLEDAISGIMLADMNWPAPHDDSLLGAAELHIESARLWVGSVIDRLEVWASRARRIAGALEVHQARRST